MAFLTDVQELKSGLVLFRRADVKHQNWYCRVKVPMENRYKTISLKTSDLREAKDKAFNHESDIRFRVQHAVPVFEKSFEQVAKEYSDFQKNVAASGQITKNRWATVDSYIRLHLIPYMGNHQITHIGEDKWSSYTLWRKNNNAPESLKKKRSYHQKLKPLPRRETSEDDQLKEEHKPAKDSTIRHEMMVFRAIMNFAASKQYIKESQVPRGKLPSDKGRREEFTPQEYRHLHTFARTWVKDSAHDYSQWYRTMAYNFVLIMCNTGMRTMEAQNLRWRDVEVRKDTQGRAFVCINVRGKAKFRELVAAENVAEYLERIKEISKSIKPDDFVFSTHQGKQAKTLYHSLILDLLTDSGLLYGANGSQRSSYCFRHTYATFRLKEGVDVYFLAKQMGTSVKMIEDYYGHITPAKNAERILQGLQGWGGDKVDGTAATKDSVNAGGGKAGTVKPRSKPKSKK